MADTPPPDPQALADWSASLDALHAAEKDEHAKRALALAYLKANGHDATKGKLVGNHLFHYDVGNAIKRIEVIQ